MSGQNNQLNVFTPQQKIIDVNKRLGNPGVANMQGSTRIIYDDIKYIGWENNFRFFEGAGSKTFPRTNLDSNKLQVGESISILRMYFMVFIYNREGHLQDWVQQNNFPPMMFADYDVVIGNKTVLKNNPLLSHHSEVNPDNFGSGGFMQGFSNFSFTSIITISPLIEFLVNLRLGLPMVPPAPLTDCYMRCVIEGMGGLLNTKVNF